MLVVIPSYSGMGISPTDDSSVVSCKRSFQESRGYRGKRGNFQKKVVKIMVDLTSRDDERAAEQARKNAQEDEKLRQRELDKTKAQTQKEGLEQDRSLEQARKKGQEEEKLRQQDLGKAKEQARKQAIADERSREKSSGGSGGLKILLYLLVLALIITVVAWLTLSVSVTNVTPGVPMPFTTNYGVSFPEGRTITIGNTHIIVLSAGNEIISDIDGDRQKLLVGEDRIISERRALITTLGAVTLLDTHFKINLKYKGERDNRAYFDMAVHTSQQVPDILLRQLLPGEIDATPI